MYKAFIAMENKVSLQCNKILHLENLMVMYRIYNSELIDTVEKMHNTPTWNESYLLVNSMLGIMGIYLWTELAIMP